MIAKAVAALKEAETSGEMRKAKERKEDLMRLKRIEVIYVRQIVFQHLFPALMCIVQSAVLPVLSGWVLVLLKLLLATVSASTSMQHPQSSTSSVFPPGVGSRKLLH
jgi:uncharacterized membrane protein